MASCIPEELVHAATPAQGHPLHASAQSGSTPRDNLLNIDNLPGVEGDQQDAASSDRPTTSVFARGSDAAVHVVPMRVIHRPLPSELDEAKVQAFMEEMKAGDVFTPIEVVKVRAPPKNDPTRTMQNYYFAMGGCHRYEATKRLGLETIRAKIIEVPPSNMRIYLGSRCPF